MQMEWDTSVSLGAEGMNGFMEAGAAAAHTGGKPKSGGTAPSSRDFRS